MRKPVLLLMMLLLTALLCGCTPAAQSIPHQTGDSGASQPVAPVAEAPESLHIDANVALFFRYMDEPYLAAEARTVTQRPSQPWENTLISALLSGPETHSTRLNALFPQGTRLIATAREGRTLFVTLSSEIMNAYSDEPVHWQDDAYWSAEVPRRRQLCMQSLVATVTENSDVDRVQVLVAQADASGSSYRLPQSYFKTTDIESPAPLLTRDGAVLLTPENTMQRIASAWLQQDWAALYSYLRSESSEALPARMDYRAFVSTMEALPRLTACTVSSGSVSFDGAQATFSLTATAAGEQPISGIVRLVRTGSVWCITLSELTGWLEV